MAQEFRSFLETNLNIWEGKDQTQAYSRKLIWIDVI